MDRYLDQANTNAAMLQSAANAQTMDVYGAINEPRPMTHTEAVTNSLQSLLASLNDSNARLQEARDRMFGGQPPESSKEAPRAIPNGRADEIEILLGACHAAAERTSMLAGELLRRL